MALVDVRGFNVQAQAPSLTPGLQELAGFQALGQQNIQAGREEQIRQLLGQAVQPPTEQQQMLAAESFLGEQAAELAGPTQEQLIQQAKSVDPIMAEELFSKVGLDTASKRADASRFASTLQGTPPDRRASLINARAQEIQARGGNNKDTLELLDMTPEEQNQVATTIQLADLSTKERFAAIAVGAKAKLSDLKKDLAGTKETFDRASKIRGEIAKASTEFNKVNSAFGRVNASAEDPSPAGDLALIFNFMKVLDPGSTVREGEFATAQNAGGVGTRVQSLYNNIIEGTRLTSGQREDFVGRSKKLFTQAEKTNKDDIAKFVSIGKQFGVTRENLLGQQPESNINTQTASIAELQAEAARLRQQGQQ